MVNRKKRLQKGIESLEKQIKLHEEKLKKVEEEDNIELAQYYKKEINAKKLRYAINPIWQILYCMFLTN